MAGWAELAGYIRDLDEGAASEAISRQAILTKPAGALGRLEDLSIKLAGITGRCPPPVPEAPRVVVFAGDHGVLAEGVTPWPAEVTAQMVANFLGGGAAINAIARQVGAEVVVVDVGVATEIPGGSAASDKVAPGTLVSLNVRRGTGNIAVEAAMTTAEAEAALDAGAHVASELIAAGCDLLITGDMGIGNTTPSAALIAAITGSAPREVTGRGTGIDDGQWENKVAVVERALERHAASGNDGPLALVAGLGGLEIAAIAGLVIGAAAARVPVLIDGVIAGAGALVAASLAPGALAYMIAGHRSTEPGASAALRHLDLDPLLDLGLRLGEGTGACLAVPIVQAAARTLGEMATFGDAGVSEKTE